MDVAINIRFSYAFPQPYAEKPAPAAEAPAKPADTEETAPAEGKRGCACQEERVRSHDGQGRRHGRRHVQRAARHLLRDIRHDMRGELKELRETGDTEKVKAVKSAYRDFRSGVKDVFKSHDRGAFAEGLSTAMAAFTEALREINGAGDEVETQPAPVVDPVVKDEKTPATVDEMPVGTLLDVGV